MNKEKNYNELVLELLNKAPQEKIRRIYYFLKGFLGEEIKNGGTR